MQLLTWLVISVFLVTNTRRVELREGTVVNEEHFLHSWFKKEEFAEPNRWWVITNWTYFKKCQDLWAVERIEGLGKNDMKHATLCYHLLLLAELWRSLYSGCFLLYCQSPFFGLESDIFLSALQWFHLHAFCNYAQAKSVISFTYLKISTVMNKINLIYFDLSVLIN